VAFYKYSTSQQKIALLGENEDTWCYRDPVQTGIVKIARAV
jgi:hypothetical protein